MNKKITGAFRALFAPAFCCAILCGCAPFSSVPPINDNISGSVSTQETPAGSDAPSHVTPLPEISITYGDLAVDAQIKAVKSGDVIPFGDIIYSPPDIDILLEQMSELTARLPYCQSYDEVYDNTKKFNDLYEYFETARKLANIFSLTDPGSNELKEAESALGDDFDYIAAAVDDYVNAIVATGYWERASGDWKSLFYGYYLADGPEEEADNFDFFENDMELVSENHGRP